MKAYHLTNNHKIEATAHPLYEEALKFGLELKKLTEGKALNQGEIHTLFTNAEQVMTAGGGNRTMLGKAGEMAGALGQKIKGLAQALQDTTPIKGVDSMFDDLKQKASLGMGKSPQGSSVLRAIDKYKQIVQRHPNTSKFFWGVAGVLTGLLTSGVAPLVVLGTMKTIDGLLQNKQLSTSVGGAAGTVGTALGAKALAGAGKALANTTIPDINNPFAPKVDPSVVDPSVVDPNNVVPPKPTDPTVVPGAETQTITVKQGDTLSQLADTHKVNPDELAKLNPGKFGPGDNPNILHPGDQIVLPKNIDAAAYKGAYQGDNAMTAQNILNKQQAGQYGADGGMAAKAVAKAKAGAGAGKAVAAKGAAAPAQAAAGGNDIIGAIANKSAQAAKAAQGAVQRGGDIIANRLPESFKFKAGRGVLEGIQLITLPTAYTVDKPYTIQKWALNESLGRERNSVQLTEHGIMTLFMNLQRIDEAVYDRPGNANDPRAMAKNKPAPNTSNTAGPQGQLPGGNVGGLATGTAPAGNTLPYLAADPEGKFDTKSKGAVSTGLSRGIETGLGRAGNWIKDKWKDMTTKVTADGLKRHWKDAGSPVDSDEVAKVLQRLKVPADVITQLYQQLNFPAPRLEAPPAQDAAAASTGAGGAGAASTVDAYNRDRDGEVRTFANGMPAMNQTVGSTDAADATAGVQQAGGMGNQQGGANRGIDVGAGGLGGTMGGDGQTSQATSMILPQLARMTGPGYADDLITIIDTAFSVLQRGAPLAYREKLMQLRGVSSGKQRTKAQDIIKGVKNKKKTKVGAPAADAPPATRPLGPSRVAPNNPGAPTDAERSKFDQRVAQATGTLGESRKVYGGKYIKESADQKIAREFEKFVMNLT